MNLEDMFIEVGLLSGEGFRFKHVEDFNRICLDTDSLCYEFYDIKNRMIASFPVHNLAYISILKENK